MRYASNQTIGPKKLFWTYKFTLGFMIISMPKTHFGKPANPKNQISILFLLLLLLLLFNKRVREMKKWW